MKNQFLFSSKDKSKKKKINAILLGSLRMKVHNAILFALICLSVDLEFYFYGIDFEYTESS